MKLLVNKKYNVDSERHYNQLTPGVLIEEYLGGLDDYKFHCFGSEIGFIQVDKGRDSKRVQGFYDCSWERMPFRKLWIKDTIDFEKPENLQGMVDIVGKLLKKIGDTPFVRIDLYNKDGVIYFGEYTFTPACGNNPLVPEKYNEKYGI
jgi:hypothetical protein